MSGAKTLTVAVPVYNTAPWLGRCLDSVLNAETPPNVEIIAVDDGSTDASPAILRDYRQRFPDSLRIIEQENRGHGPAVAAALVAASGRYFRVLDSDDWLDTPHFIRYVNLLRGCTEDLIVTPYSQEFADGREIRRDYPFLDEGRTYRFEEISWRDGMDYFCLASSTWRTELLRACALRLPAHCSYVDMLYALRPVPAARSLRFLKLPLYRYWIGREGQSMDPAVFQHRTPMHQRVLTLLLEDYRLWEGRLSLEKRAYLLLVLRYMLHTHAQLLCVDGSGSRRSFAAARELDRVLLDCPALREMADSLPLWRTCRRCGFLPLLLLRPGTARRMARLLRRRPA